jgi:Bacterial regulatory helix-turn-helix protein, lysR family
MDLRKIRYFFAVIEHRNLSGAAQALRISQPTLSRHMQALEDQFKTPLFVRSSRGMLPTEAGGGCTKACRDWNGNCNRCKTMWPQRCSSRPAKLLSAFLLRHAACSPYR